MYTSLTHIPFSYDLELQKEIKQKQKISSLTYTSATNIIVAPHEIARYQVCRKKTVQVTNYSLLDYQIHM